MRAYEIALFIVMVAAGFGIISSLDIFPADAIPIDSSLFTPYTVSALSNFPTHPSLVDYFFLMVTLIVNTIMWAMTILLTITIFYPYLSTVLGIPEALSIPLNAGIWFVFVIAIVQVWRSQSIDIMR